jgi:DNA-binding beta-propeller fold protein YncE
MMAAVLSLMPVSAWAGLAISANDGKQVQKGEDIGVTPDSVTVINLSVYPPKVIGDLRIPAAMIGSPNAVAIGAGEQFAIVTAAQKIDPADPTKPVPSDQVSVIDLANPARPRLLQTVRGGANAAGLSINKAGTLVLVAARNDDAIFIFTLKNKRLTPAGRVDLDKGAEPTDVVFTPDGRKAYVTTWGQAKVVELSVDGARVARTKRDIATGLNPYGAVITPDGNWLISTNVGGALMGTDRTGTLTMIDLKTPRLALSLPVGRTPEHVMLSPDGKYALVVLANGAAYVKTDPSYDKVRGILKIFAVGPGKLTEVAQSPSCHWNQGATWSDDGKLVLAQCASERTIETYRFDGKSLVRDDAATLKFESRPGTLATLRAQ